TSGVRVVGDWTPVAAAFDDLPLDGLSDLRAGFELRSAGDAWIDDVALHHLRFGPGERVELFKIITSAQLKLEHGEWSDCLRLLEGYWPQFWGANVPLSAAQIAERMAARPDRPEVPVPPASEEERPSWWRRLLPGRFFR